MQIYVHCDTHSQNEMNVVMGVGAKVILLAQNCKQSYVFKYNTFNFRMEPSLINFPMFPV